MADTYKDDVTGKLDDQDLDDWDASWDDDWNASFDGGCGSGEDEEEPPTLTQRTEIGGWAAKWKPGEFDSITHGIITPFSQEEKTGLVNGDDCAVVRINGEQAAVFSVDWFPPVVDDPYEFGAIAAASSLSNLYAMGVKPLTALNIMALPCKMGVDQVGEVMRGGSDKVVEAGAFVVGGHSIDNNEPKYGLAAFGTARPDQIVRNENAEPGDVLFYTKPLGSGVMIEAFMDQQETDDSMRAVIDSMLELNKAAAEAMLGLHVHAAISVAGMGLAGHLHMILESCGAGATLQWSAIPLFERAWQHCIDGTYPLRTDQAIPWARQFVDLHLPQGANESAVMALLCDPQTSGGLLVAFPEEEADDFAKAFTRISGREPARIGQLTADDAGRITVE